MPPAASAVHTMVAPTGCGATTLDDTDIVNGFGAPGVVGVGVVGSGVVGIGTAGAGMADTGAAAVIA